MALDLENRDGRAALRPDRLNELILSWGSPTAYGTLVLPDEVGNGVGTFARREKTIHSSLLSGWDFRVVSNAATFTLRTIRPLFLPDRRKELEDQADDRARLYGFAAVF
jgi:hypothetical protein